jgi:hypothetical protein
VRQTSQLRDRELGVFLETQLWQVRRPLHDAFESVIARRTTLTAGTERQALGVLEQSEKVRAANRPQ